jgi:PAS domain S-box-containing protein
MTKVLVVDNNPVLLKALSAILEREGCEVRAVGNGLEAIETLKHFVPEMVFTDLVMPLVGGEQLCRIIRNTPQLADICVVVISAVVLEEKEHILQELGCDLCIAKGSLKEMRQHVLDALQSCRRNESAAHVRNPVPERQIPKGLRPSSVTTELLSQARHIASIVDNLREGMIELSRNGKIVSLNREAVAILGGIREEMIGRSLEELPWQEHRPRLVAWMRDELIGGGMGRMEIEELQPLEVNGRVLTVSLIPICEEADLFGVCILRDISRQYHAERHKRELDEALRLARQMDALSSMAGGFAHDFNNLLTVICGNLDLLATSREHRLESGNQDLLANAQRAADVAVDLVKKISCFSSYGIISRDQVQIRQAIQGAVESYFRKHPGLYDFSCAGGESYVQFDAAQIETVVHNILQNATEAAGNAEIRIVLEDMVVAAPTILAGQYIPAGRYARVDIIDQGPGMTSEKRLKIFDPYYSTKQRGAVKGLGLGLTIVYSTMRTHGGNVIVASEPGVGTTVSLLFPVYALSRGVFPKAESDGRERLRILFVEEDEQLREIGRIMLDYLGYPVSVADGPDAALALIEQARLDEAARYDVAIIDMPGTGNEDLDLCRRFQGADPLLKIIAASASISDTTLAGCRQYGCVNALPKPYSIDTLGHILSTLEG